MLREIMVDLTDVPSDRLLDGTSALKGTIFFNLLYNALHDANFCRDERISLLAVMHQLQYWQTFYSEYHINLKLERTSIELNDIVLPLDITNLTPLQASLLLLAILETNLPPEAQDEVAHLEKTIMVQKLEPGSFHNFYEEAQSLVPYLRKDIASTGDRLSILELFHIIHDIGTALETGSKLEEACSVLTNTSYEPYWAFIMSATISNQSIIELMATTRTKLPQSICTEDGILDYMLGRYPYADLIYQEEFLNKIFIDGNSDFIERLVKNACQDDRNFLMDLAIGHANGDALSHLLASKSEDGALHVRYAAECHQQFHDIMYGRLFPRTLDKVMKICEMLLSESEIDQDSPWHTIVQEEFIDHPKVRDSFTDDEYQAVVCVHNIIVPLTGDGYSA